MKNTIAILAGDGIGPEIMSVAECVLEKINQKFGHEISAQSALIGALAYDKYGQHLPQETLDICQNASAILFGAVGGPVNDQENPRYKNVEKNVILTLRKKFDLFANLRPLKVWPVAKNASPLKDELIKDIDIVVIRELVSGIYFGPRKTYESQGEMVAEDVCLYRESEIRRIAEVGFKTALGRRKKLTVVDKANVLDTSRLWRMVVEKIRLEYPAVMVEYMFVDNAAMQMVRNPASFDVIVTENMFGDILSDLGGAIVGSIGLLPSASLNSRGFGLFEPIHGSAPDIAEQNIANPTAQILSLAMLLNHSLGLTKEATAIEAAIMAVWEKGYKTKDLAVGTEKFVGTKKFGELVSNMI